MRRNATQLNIIFFLSKQSLKLSNNVFIVYCPLYEKNWDFMFHIRAISARNYVKCHRSVHDESIACFVIKIFYCFYGSPWGETKMHLLLYGNISTNNGKRPKCFVSSLV